MKPGNVEKLKEMFSLCPDILFRENYIKSAINLLLILRNGEYHFLFEKRSSQIRQGGEICFPGGMFDPIHDRDFQQTAVRETSEELGIPLDKIRIIGKMGTLLTPQGVLVEGYLGIGQIAFEEIVFDHREVEYIFSIPVSYFEEQEPDRYQLEITISPAKINTNGQGEILFPAQELGLPNMYHSPWQGKKHHVYVYNYHGEVIWGITASFIYDFVKRYKMLFSAERIKQDEL